MSTLSTVSDCSAQQYCTQSDQPLNYDNQYIIKWNNNFPPLNPESQVTVSVYSTYDLTTPIFQQSTTNTNGMIALQPSAGWFSQYTGSDARVGENQQIFLAVYLQGNDPPAASSMLQLRLTATPEQYAEIQSILHPSPASSSSSTSSASESSESSETSELSESSASSSSGSSSLSSAQPTLSSTVELSESPTPTQATNGHKRGLSAGAIAGITVGAVVFLLLLLLLLLVLYRRRQRTKRGQAKHSPPDSAFADPIAPTADEKRHLNQPISNPSPTDTPLLLAGRPNNNSFTSHDGSSLSHPLSPSYRPLTLESPRVLMHMPASTRSEQILTTQDARQIGDIFRDALRKPPVSEDGEGGVRDSIVDELEEDPGWRERVASERMQRELEQEASVIRSVAMKAHGSEYSSRPGTSQTKASQ
ncbi:hypothetical protein BX070DRAFT_231220 [Coemansia spiralis]|nr:hypothetical protein BX070DRAFT_231220 [Coemansia spiralis]